MAKVFTPTPEMILLKSLPGVALILSVVIGLEIGDIRRFKWAGRLASYAGTGEYNIAMGWAYLDGVDDL